tara:strand:+ start:401 stop:628 length:228 start_codon:yes stop_codon:yes gene_type:complete
LYEFSILALSLNFLWLPLLINLFLDILTTMRMNDEAYNIWFQGWLEEANPSIREKLITWISVPLGWIVAAFLMVH